MLERAPATPFLTLDVPAVPGVLREKLEDFSVEEVPAYVPCGTGEHVYVRFEKRDLTTPDAVRRIARALGVDERDAGYAGLKDRRAVTTQWASFARADVAKAEQLAIDQVRVLEVSRHGNKLRTGHLRGNRFRIVLRPSEPWPDPAAALERAKQTLAILERRGAPAYFGPQRFGRDNLPRAHRWLALNGKPPRDRFERKFLVSTLQSAVFNAALARRIEEGAFDRALEGDVFRVEATGGLFTTDDLANAASRVAAFEISPTGPMPGPKMREPSGPARAFEEAAFMALTLDPAIFARLGPLGEGARRPVRFRVTDASVEPNDGALTFALTLPRGAYATVVLREVTKSDDDPRAPDVEPD